MLRGLFQLLAVLCPLVLFALALPPVQQRLYGGQPTEGILLLLGGLALLAVVEGLIFRCWILPGWSGCMAERLYAGSYVPGNDALATLVEQIEREQKVELLPSLEKLVRCQRWRLRGWLELARLQQEMLHDAPAALATLQKGAESVRDPEDAALLLYRTARICEHSLHDAAAARHWLQQAAVRYPATVYGHRAASRLS